MGLTTTGSRQKRSSAGTNERIKAMLPERQSTKVEAAEYSRRRFLAGAGAGALLLTRRPLIAQKDGIVPTMVNAAEKAKIIAHPLRRNITVLEGSGGNIAVLTGRDGKLLVDAGFKVSRPALSNALTAISADPITHLINTHWHTDHTDGNEWLHSVGAAITAHENTRKHLSVSTRVEAWNYTFPAAPSGGLPTKVFMTDSDMRRNDTRILMKYYGRHIPTATSRSTSSTPMYSMSVTLGGTEFTPSSTTPPEAASTDPFAPLRPIWRR
jgi:hypothetical protein